VLYVGNIPWDATEEEVMAELCAVLGRAVLSFKLIRTFDAEDIIPGSPKRRLHRGFGFMELVDEDAAMAAIRNHKRLLIFCRNRRLRIAYACKQHHSSSSSVVHKEEKIKQKIDHQHILLTSSCSEKKKKSSIAVVAIRSEQKTPIVQHPPKHLKKNSISELDQHVKEKKKAAPKKKRPHSAISTSPSAGSCLECSQYGEEKPHIHDAIADHLLHSYSTSVRCYYCNSASKRQRFVSNGDGADLDHIINHPKKSDSPQYSRYFSCHDIYIADSS
jgi:RNA recognition motif-containing protein